MRFKSLLIWLGVGAVLFVIIYLIGNSPRSSDGPERILPALRATAVTSVQVRPRGELEIRAERTNDTWMLAEPIFYPADRDMVEGLLGALQTLTPAALISRKEINAKPKAEEEYGFASPQATIIIRQGDYLIHIFIGAHTAPGNQVFMQVVGHEGIYVIDAGLLSFIPVNPSAWREKKLFTADPSTVTRVIVTNAAKRFEISRSGTNQWQIITPGARARGDNGQIEDLFTNVQAVRALSFVSDSATPDLDAFGLQSPDVTLVFDRGTNSLAVIQTGKAVTNSPSQYYAKVAGRVGIVTVAKALIDPWRTANDLRDMHLITPGFEIGSVGVQSAGSFSLTSMSNGGWRVEPGNTIADSQIAKVFVENLEALRIAQVVKEVVTEPDLPAYGLARPAARYELLPPKNAAATNSIVVSFGSNTVDKVYARRGDESAVYAVDFGDFLRLASAPFQFRDRRVWDFPHTNVSAVVISRGGKERRLVRKSPYDWSLAPGSRGIIEPLAIEETVRPLCHLIASDWLACGNTNRIRFGLTNGDCKISIESAGGSTHEIELGDISPSSFPCAGVTLDGELWVCELPPGLARDIVMYVAPPPPESGAEGHHAPAAGTASLPKEN
jgi:hypothetical protein